jgi:hypothetical protein
MYTTYIFSTYCTYKRSTHTRGTMDIVVLVYWRAAPPSPSFRSNPCKRVSARAPKGNCAETQDQVDVMDVRDGKEAARRVQCRVYRPWQEIILFSRRDAAPPLGQREERKEEKI